MRFKPLFAAFLTGLLLTVSSAAQMAPITYQGKLTDGASPANGPYDFRFRLFDGLGSATSLAESTADDLQVVAGIFKAELSFDSEILFKLPEAWLEIAVRPGASTGSYTVLNPRQKLTDAPYAAKSRRSEFASAATTADTANLALLANEATNAVNAQNAISANTANTAESAVNVLGIVGIGNGGTGSNTKNFVDLTTNQNISGVKTFTGSLVANGSLLTNLSANNISSGAVAVANGGTGGATAAAARANLGLGSLSTVTPAGNANPSNFLRGDSSWAEPPLLLLASVSLNSTSSGGTYYHYPLGRTSAADTGQGWLRVPRACTLSSFTVLGFGSPAFGYAPRTFTVVRISNGVLSATDLSIFMDGTDGGPIGSSPATVALAANDRISIRDVSNSGGAASAFDFSLKCE